MPHKPALVRLCALLALCCVAAVAGCSKRDAPSAGAGGPAATPATPAADPAPAADRSLEAARAERKIIRNAELTVSVESPAQAARDAAAIARRFGGFVGSTETWGPRENDAEASVKVVLKVKADRFDDALSALRALGSKVGSESISTDDVTEEYLDLDARLRTEKKLETQYLTLLERAGTVDEMLKVQKHLAEVRGSIEKLEGRKRFLDGRIDLSTITVTFGAERPLVVASTSAITGAAKQAAADVVNVGAALIVGTLRLLGVLLPVSLLVLLPLVWLFRRLWKRLGPARHALGF